VADDSTNYEYVHPRSRAGILLLWVKQAAPESTPPAVYMAPYWPVHAAPLHPPPAITHRGGKAIYCAHTTSFTTLDQADEEVLTYTASDEALEAAADQQGAQTTMYWTEPTMSGRCC
jgi:hypothetical protein